MFDDNQMLESHSIRGWSPRRDTTFLFHHRYLSYSNKVSLNNYGFHQECISPNSKEEGCIRIGLFGDSTLLGVEHDIEYTIPAKLRNMLINRFPGKKIEVFNVSCKDYCTEQLMQWWNELSGELGLDIVVYLFVTNHPRRNITIHESGKGRIFLKEVVSPVQTSITERLRVDGVTHINDMIYVDEVGCIQYEKGSDAGILYRVVNNSWILAKLEQIYFGNTRLRKYKDRKEIKTIDVDSDLEDVVFPYHWRITERILENWASTVRNKGAEFIVVPFLNYYHAGERRLYEENDHPFGINFEYIPERRFLPEISKRCGFQYFDSYRFAKENHIKLDRAYIHPRYAYPSLSGCETMAIIIQEALCSSYGGLPKFN
ncbi:MAG: hypothetical protein OEX19_00145 [Gammaproteobacteria bacterium]|nr:hypothetical protein [Gammaproteobacteria bacterium]